MLCWVGVRRAVPCRVASRRDAPRRAVPGRVRSGRVDVCGVLIVAWVCLGFCCASVLSLCAVGLVVVVLSRVLAVWCGWFEVAGWV